MSTNARQGPHSNSDEVLTSREAAAYLKSSERWLRDQPIPRAKVGRLVRYRRVDLDAFLASHLSLGEQK